MLNHTEKLPLATLEPPGYPYVSRPLSDVFPLALAGWPACWSVAWEPERVQASPCQACPTFPKSKGHAEERRGGGAHWTQSFPPAPPTFRIPRPIPRGPAPTKKTPTVPPNPSCCNSFKQSRREIRRAAGTCKCNNGRTFTRVAPRLQPCGTTCVLAGRHSSKIRSQNRGLSERLRVRW